MPKTNKDGNREKKRNSNSVVDESIDSEQTVDNTASTPSTHNSTFNTASVSCYNSSSSNDEMNTTRTSTRTDATRGPSAFPLSNRTPTEQDLSTLTFRRKRGILLETNQDHEQQDNTTQDVVAAVDDDAGAATTSPGAVHVGTGGREVVAAAPPTGYATVSSTNDGHFGGGVERRSSSSSAGNGDRDSNNDVNVDHSLTVTAHLVEEDDNDKEIVEAEIVKINRKNYVFGIVLAVMVIAGVIVAVGVSVGTPETPQTTSAPSAPAATATVIDTNTTNEIDKVLEILTEFFGFTPHPNTTSLNAAAIKLRGTIPSEIGILTALEYLDMCCNDGTLFGTVPSQLGMLTKLTALQLKYNNLRGSLPSSFGQMSFLKMLSLQENSLSGELPTELGLMTSLAWLSLYLNRFEGRIPSEVGLLTSLSYLDLNENMFTGEIYPEVSSLLATTELSRLYETSVLGISGNEELEVPDSLLQLHDPPSNDACETAQSVSVGDVAIAGTTVGATPDILRYEFCGGNFIDRGVWYTVQGNGRNIKASLCEGTSLYFDSVIFVFEKSCDELRCVGSNNDDDESDLCQFLSTFRWESVLDATYYILVQGYFDHDDFFLAVVDG